MALDEPERGKRGKASVHVSERHSGQVWARVPLMEIDGDRWPLVWWMAQEQGIHTSWTVSDGGQAILDAMSQVGRESSRQREVWHVRLSGARLRSVAGDVRALCVVVLRSDHLRESQARQRGIETLPGMLEDVALRGTAGMHEHMQKLATHIRLALPQAAGFPPGGTALGAGPELVFCLGTGGAGQSCGGTLAQRAPASPDRAVCIRVCLFQRTGPTGPTVHWLAA